MDHGDLLFAGATHQAAALRSGHVGVRELIEATLARIAQVDPTLNAYCVVYADGALIQADAAQGTDPVHLVGHSVGGVIATLYAHQYPGDTLSLINVEGNLTLAGAFWSAEMAKMPAEQAAALLDKYRADPAAWFGATTDPCEIQNAVDMLAFQPAELDLIPTGWMVRGAKRLRTIGQPLRLRLVEWWAVGPSALQEVSGGLDLVQQNVSKRVLSRRRAGAVSRLQGARINASLRFGQ
jgi:pimeloyl-ACP methyl ester carboxylesterase